MRNALLFRLAARGLHANRRLYLPFWLSSGFIALVYYIIAAFSASADFAASIPNGGNICMLMGVGYYLLPVVIVPFLVYVNSFLLKGRSRELALYAILGLQKRHVAAVLLLECLAGLFVCLFCGIGAGMLLCPLVFRSLLAVLGASGGVWHVSPFPALATVKLFSCCFALLLAMNVWRAARTSPASLLREQKQGEKPMHARLPAALAGLVCLGWGYRLALTTSLQTFTLNSFMLALLLVILGTYFLFASGSVYVLERMRRGRRFYADPSRFVIISGLQHRMRKNAAGLTNICLFASATLFTLCCSVCVLLGQGDAIARLGQALTEGQIGLNTADLTSQEVIMEFTALAFLGLFFVLVFLACTALVLYYKQFAEGLDDAPRFRILRAVGLSDELTVRTARRQLRVVFLLPLGAALLHIAAASPILATLLNILAIDDPVIIFGGIGASMLCFCAVYAVCYRAASRTYLKMLI